MKFALVLCTMLLPVLPFDEGVDMKPIGDVLTYEGLSAKVVTTPFSWYFDNHPEARTDTDIVMTHGENYSACWEFVDSMLCLSNAWVLRSTPDSYDRMVEVMPDLFPSQKRVFADWFTGYLIIPSGPSEFHCPSGCERVAEHYTMFTVLHGMMTSQWSMTGNSYCDFQESQYRAYQQSPEYLRLFNDELTRVRQSSAAKQPGIPEVPRGDSSIAEIQLRNREYGRYMSIIRDTVMERR